MGPLWIVEKEKFDKKSHLLTGHTPCYMEVPRFVGIPKIKLISEMCSSLQFKISSIISFNNNTAWRVSPEWKLKMLMLLLLMSWKM